MATIATTPKKSISYDINLPYTETSTANRQTTRYPLYLPTWDDVWYNPIPLFNFEDPALRVEDKNKPTLLALGMKIEHIQPHIGSIITNIQLNQLSDTAKDELALLISERKVLSFPDQNLVNDGPSNQQDFMKYFGKLNYQPVSGTVKGYPGFHIIYRNGDGEEITKFLQHKSTTTLWHQDVSFEAQPPGYVMLALLEGPIVGGDTIFAATDEAYNRLSPTFGKLLDKLKTLHSSAKIIGHVQELGGLVRKNPIESVHPLVRVHPVSSKKCLFLNDEFIIGIQGLKDRESRVLLDFLLQHMITGHDFQVRVKWQPKTIVMFDNRSTIHSAIVDYIDEENNAELRHVFRLCAMAEVPRGVEDM